MSNPHDEGSALAVEDAVRARYSAGALRREESLCCPVSHDPALLAAIPAEVLERDYGCGDPTRHLRTGERVLDLGSGGGKACFLASQVVGPGGSVLGIDSNDEMLALARSAAPEVARRLGFANVSFRKGRIQDLALDLDRLQEHLARHPVRTADDLSRLEGVLTELRGQQPLVPAASIDVVVSNCVLNLVATEDKQRLFAEMYRVLRRGGRAVISDIVSDEDVPEPLLRDGELWSGCVAGAFREDRLLAAFEAAGFHGITIVERQATPWRVVEGIEFRSLTVAAYKGKEGRCLDQKHALVYRGPFREVRDDDGHVLRRGERAAVCEKTYHLLTQQPYGGHFLPVPPAVLVPLEEAPAFACGDRRRDPRETKGELPRTTSAPAGCCEPGDSAPCC